MDFLQCPNDQSLGPAVEGCRDDFDFTIKFEQVFLSILPASVFIALCFPRIVYLTSRRVIVNGYHLQYVKIFSIFVYSALQLFLLILSSIRDGRFKIFFVSSSAISFLAALCMSVVSYFEHARSPRPSLVLTAYLSLSILLDATQTRTLWLSASTNDEKIFTKAFTTALGVKLLATFLEAQQKTRWIRWETKEHSPEETSGLLDLGAFLWLNRLFLTGYRKTLTLDDLFPLDQTMASEPLQANLSSCLSQTSHSNRKYELAMAISKSLAIPLLLPVGPRIAMTALQFCQPFLISLLLDYLQETHKSDKNIGYGLIGATFLVYIGLALFGAFYWYLQERAMYMVRGALAGAVYRKVVEAKLSATEDSAALTLMSADIERIIMGAMNLHEFWANTVQVGLASWLLSREIGPAAIAPLVVVICSVMASSFLSRLTGPRQKAWMERIQKRVSLTTNIIRQMNQLKIAGLATIVEETIQNMRVEELRSASKFRMVITIAAVIAYVPLCISPVVTFVFASHNLNITTIFTAISYILLLATPLGMILQMLPAFISSFTCLERIQKFLEKESRSDFRIISLEPEQNNICRKLTANGTAPKLAPSVNISGGNFGWEVGKISILDIDLEIPASKLTMIIGPVGSGKSTLCKALLGEAPVARENVRIGVSSQQIGYCDQTPYLQNSSIRENIVGFAPFEQSRYDEVLEATMLKPDLASLPLQDETRVGSNGITLSGGQKQRVALARALYLDSNLLILDDILSGLDVDTGDRVFRNVFAIGGILYKRGATAVLSTHNIRHLPSADHIIALRSDGSLEYQGPYGELMVNEGYIRGLRVEEDESTIIQDTPNQSESRQPTRTELSTSKTAGSLPFNFGNEKTRITGDISVYRHYVSRLSTLSLVAFITFGAGWGFFSNFTTIWLKFWSEDITSTSPSRSSSFYLGLYALFQISTLACLMFVCLVCFKSMIQVSGAKLHKEALSTVVNAPLKFFTSTDTGVVINLFSQDLNIIDGELPLAFINLNNRLFTSLGMAAVVATSSVYLIITFPILAIIIYGIQKFYLRTSRQMRLLDLEAKSPLYSQFVDTIKGVVTIRAFGWAKDVIALNDKFLDNSQRPAYLLAMIQRWLQFVLQVLVAALATAVVALATQLRSNSAFTGASLVTLMTFGNSLSFLIRVYTVVETSIGAVSRLKTFSECVRSENMPGEDVVPPIEWPLRGNIEIRDVSATYVEMEERVSGAAFSHGDSQIEPLQHLALVDFNLSIAPGEKVAICGRTGSGKSSIILLLLRLLNPQSASDENIIIDDIPLHRIDRSVLRQRIVAVPQEAVFLPDGTSFQANLDTHDQLSETECLEVLEIVDLRAAIDERGGLAGAMVADSLSQGQKQLFSLARAVVRQRARLRFREAIFGNVRLIGDGGILLLDEFSSGVDDETEKKMLEIIRIEFKAYTVIMVTHHLDMVMDFDTVVVMDKGMILEKGKPNELSQKEGSSFRKMWKAEKNGVAL